MIPNQVLQFSATKVQCAVQIRSNPKIKEHSVTPTRFEFNHRSFRSHETVIEEVITGLLPQTVDKLHGWLPHEVCSEESQMHGPVVDAGFYRHGCRFDGNP